MDQEQASENGNDAAQAILLDTNSLLSAALLPQSFSSLAVSLIRGEGVHRFMVSDGVMREAKKVIKCKARTEAQLNLANMRIEALLSELAAVMVPEDDQSPAPSCIPKADRHVFHAAHHHGASVLTSDVELWIGLHELNMSAMLPLAWIRKLNGLALQSTVFGIMPKPEAGSVFFRAYPGAWAGAKSGKFTAASLAGVLWIYYDASSFCWLAEVQGLAKPLRCSAPILEPTLQTVSLSWKCSAEKAKIELRIAGAKHPDTQSLESPLALNNPVRWSVGCCQGANYYWNASIYFCIVNDRPMGRKSWANCQRHRDLATNPFDADRLDQAIADI